MLTRLLRVTVLIAVYCLLSSGFYVMGQEIDRTDPVKMSNFILDSIKNGRYYQIVQVMNPQKAEEYLPFDEGKLRALESLFSRDQKKIGNTTAVSELRKVNSFVNREGLAAKVNKKGDEVFVILLSKDGDQYYFEDTLTISKELYEKLEFIRKVE